ncbi:MAG: efflux RND transporter permease subunit, partial [Deltaproteobacteria bacterium]|nr:efflux RND transporter permease subunit [Deltaproteobacteria bacterium]
LPVIFLSLSGDVESKRLRRLFDEKVRPRLERLEGVAAIDVRGAPKREVHVDLDPAALRRLRISPDEIAVALRRDNRNVAAGQVTDSGREVVLRSVGEALKVRELEEIIVATREGHPVRLREIGRVFDDTEELVNKIRVGGESAVRLAVIKQAAANTVEVSARVAAEVAKINADTPGVRLTTIVDTSDFIKSSVSNVQESVLVGAVLAIFVLIFFLRSARATLVIAISIPISIIVTFAGMYLGKISLNMISFGGLALGVGMLVDASIVILENIFRHHEAGKSPVAAAEIGSSEVMGPVASSTITNFVVFAPVVFLGGFAKIFFGEMAFVVTLSLCASLLVAFMLVPVLASKFLAKEHDGGGRFYKWSGRWLDRLDAAYARLIHGALRFPKTIVLGAVLLVASSFVLVPKIGFELIPSSDQSTVEVNVDRSVGTPLEKTDQTIAEVERRIVEAIPETELTLAIAGTPGFWSNKGAETGMVRVNLVPVHARKRSSDEVASALRARLGGLVDTETRVNSGEAFFVFAAVRGGGDRLQVDVRGFDMETGSRLAKKVKEVLASIPGVAEPRISRAEGKGEEVVRVDRDRATALGVAPGVVADTLATMSLGKTATFLRIDGEEIGVVVRVRREGRRVPVSRLMDLPIAAPSGEMLPLRHFVKTERLTGPVDIDRQNGERIINVTAAFAGRDLGSIVRDLQERLAKIDIPKGFTANPAGEFAESAKTFGLLLVGAVLAILLVYMVMAAQFESYLHPLLTMTTIPFGLFGVLWTLYLTGTTFNIHSFLGMIVLAGVTVNNAIVLIDYTNLLRRTHGMSLADAVPEAGRRRLRPVLMTTLTTVIALFPAAIGLGEGSEQQTPLARVVFGGLIASTLVTLVVIPALYFLFERWFERRAARRRQGASSEAATGETLHVDATEKQS